MNDTIDEKEYGKNKSYSLKKIPISNNINVDIINNPRVDKIKIIELSNSIDKWENEIIFGENGFYSLKGTEPKDKLDEYVKELEKFINTALSEISFDDISMKSVAFEIKSNKILSVKKEMMKYAQKELLNWEFSVYEEALQSCIQRAVLYKNNKDIVNSSLKNGISVINIIAEKEQWSVRLLNKKIEKYKSNFYYSLIESFIEDKDISASIYFEQYKDILDIKEKEKITRKIQELKNNIIAYNWAKELFSYELSIEEQQKKINEIKDKDVQQLVKNFLTSFLQTEKNKKEEEDKANNIKNWAEIEKNVKTDIDKAVLFIDYGMKSENIKLKKDYIKQIKKTGHINTNKEKFIEIIQEVFCDFDEFKKKDISDFISFLSTEDYELFNEFKNIDLNEYEYLKFDYSYLNELFKENKIIKKDKIYDFIKLYIYSLKEMKKMNKKNIDVDTRNKIIDSILYRFKEKTRR